MSATKVISKDGREVPVDKHGGTVLVPTFPEPNVREITLENVGPVKRCTIPIPPNGGIVVLKGRNGSGKSHVLAAVEALTSGDGSVPVRDGQTKATVEGLGATLKVSKRATRSGELEVVSLEGGVDPSTLVDPGISDPEKADAQRIKALLTLARAEASPDQFSGLMPGVTLPLGDETDPVRLAATAKRAYQARARDAEQEAELARREAESLESPVDGFRYSGPTDPKTLQAELEAATRRKMQLDAQVEANEAATVRANEALAKVRQLSEGHAEKLSDAKRRCEQSQATWDGLEREISELSKRLKEVESRRDEAEQATELLCGEIQQLEAAGKTIADLEAEIDKAAGIVPVDPNHIDAAAHAVETATENIRLAEKKRQHDANVAKCQAAKVKGSSALLAARDARAAADKCDTVLSTLISSCQTGLFVDGGRLKLSTDRGEDELYSDLSHGERWRLAIDVCISSVGAAGLIVIPQESWEGLDPIARGELADHAREVGVTVITAECDACDMTTEVL